MALEVLKDCSGCPWNTKGFGRATVMTTEIRSGGFVAFAALDVDCNLQKSVFAEGETRNQAKKEALIGIEQSRRDNCPYTK